MFTKESEYIQNVTNWRNKPSSYRVQTILEVATWFQESDQKIDRYFFDEDQDGDLTSAGFKVRDSIRRHTAIGQKEGLAFDRLEQSRKEGEELFFWISPPHPDRGPDLKVVITEAINHQGRRRWLNRSLLLNLDDQRSLEFAADLAKLSKDQPIFRSIEDVRVNPLIMDPDQDWIEALAKAADNPRIAEVLKSGQDFVDQEAALQRAEQFYNEILAGPSKELRISNPVVVMEKYQIGQHMGPCPPETAFGIFYNSSLPINLKSVSLESKRYPDFPCPNESCGKLIPSGKGLTKCPHCGAKKEDYANCT